MDNSIIELYPNSGRIHPLKNLYLNQLANLPKKLAGQPFIYSNFIASLDGRIALPGSGRKTLQVPSAIANARDWRLFQELAAQADLLITTARFFRQADSQEAQAGLPVGRSSDFADLRDWRVKQGLKPQPDIAIFSASLDIPPASLNHYSDRQLYLITGKDADKERLEQLSTHCDIKVIYSGDGEQVNAGNLRAQLGTLGYQRVYAIAGPAVLHALATANALDRLYHTTAHCLLGGTEFDTFVRGKQLLPALQLPLRALYLDRSSPSGCGQTLAVYGD
ncbi:2,5-diamino-6-ribosylamino-pyrimidinone 5-phosphate reductase homolog [hydrothermal vent metagenome]|uniref:2,5-diamino-6-ribosylamino-pyrimidinone 5-phosphate reductase homolog n=1 Tax=hydrothermal vent metagenome TaxID=652676 RepID=A0A3B0Y5N8_9ZZZZ